MGFKRTSEGRVFFQGAGDSANDEPELQQAAAPSQPVPKSLQQQNTQQTQFQILSLLKSLNERLKATQDERNRMRNELDVYRSVIEELENRAAKSELALSEIEQKVRHDKGGNAESRAAEAEKLARETLKELEETRRLLLQVETKADRADKHINTLATVQKSQSEKIAARLKETEERQQELGGRIEETITQQARLVRKVDKAVEDRARFMRKIERIEETVIQTRDALNARAMVLLTDQQPAVQAAVDITADPGQPAPQSVADTEAAPSWRRVLGMQPAGLIPLVIVLALAGWMVSQSPRSVRPDLSSIQPQALNDVTAPVTGPAPQAVARAPAPDWSIDQDASAFAPAADESADTENGTETDAATPADTAPPPRTSVVDDIGTVDVNDEASLQALLEKDPDAVAAKLNEIEPGNETGETSETAQAADAAPTQIASLETPEQTAPRAAAPPIGAPTKPAPALASMKPDTGLPAVVRDIETQAFNGVAEAQHDLAAIYTSGHAGVKQDYKRAAFWFRQAADNGIANARYNLGVLYHQGLGVKQDVPEALRWYKSAADLGHPEAQYNLGIAYIEGIGVPYDPVQATTYFENAADSGVMEAAYNLGLIYENGLLGKPKPDIALMWYKAAADQGSPEARAALEQLAKTLGISLDEVNRLVENIRDAKKPAAVKAAPPPAPGKTSSAVLPADTELKIADVPAGPEETTPAQTAPETVRSDEIQGRLEIVTEIQQHLMRDGLYPGPADGVIGPLTEDAIRSYQESNDLAVDGKPTAELLAYMQRTAEPSSPGSEIKLNQ